MLRKAFHISKVAEL